MKDEKRESVSPEVAAIEDAGRRFGWLAVIAVLSIIGVVAWLVLSGNE
ncbi:MAG TPA: PLDc N-terminal domain-containing protein [Acidimicrobiia bacterium]|nr:PLDc N-terminal domain-containing protein [Acidimicrobiia bacterium]